MSLRIAMVSVHTCPLAVLGGKETGGMNVYVREVSRELGVMGADVDVFTRSQNPAIPRVVPLADRVRVIHLPAGAEAPMARAEVHGHLDEFVDGVEAWRIASGVEYDAIHAHYWLSGVVALALRDRWAVPTLQMFHTLGRLKNRVATSATEREPAIRITEEARIAAAVDRVIAATEAERGYLVRDYGADPERVAVIPCGVDTELFRPAGSGEARAALGLDGGPLLLYVGRIAPIKGLRTLLDALARVRARGSGARLLIVGGDVDEPIDGHEADLRKDVTALSLDSAVRFTGPLSQERLRTYYVAADATVMPSYYESFGMVALEAMACGRPVIASRVGGLATTVQNGVTGLLVPENDVAALAECLERVIGDPRLRRRLGAQGIDWARLHRWPCIAEAVGREYAWFLPRATRHLVAGRCRG